MRMRVLLEPHPFGLNGETGQRGPRVGRTVTGVVRVDPLVVVRAEEGVEPERFGEPGDREELVVRRALLRLGEDAEFHLPMMACAGT